MLLKTSLFRCKTHFSLNKNIKNKLQYKKKAALKKNSFLMIDIFPNTNFNSFPES